jgi:hypothetical protein
MDAMQERKDLRHSPVILVGRGGEGGKRFSKPDDPSTGSSAASCGIVGNRFSKRDESSKSASGEEGSKGGKRSLKSDDSSNSFSGEDGSVSGSRKVLSRTDSPEPDDFCNRRLGNLGLVSSRSENWTPCTRHCVLDDSWNGPSSGPYCAGMAVRIMSDLCPKSWSDLDVLDRYKQFQELLDMVCVCHVPKV